MISAKKARKMVVDGGIFSFSDYLSRMSWWNDKIKEAAQCGQSAINATMSSISRPTYVKVIEKLKAKGYEVTEVENYSLIISQGHIIVKW